MNIHEYQAKSLFSDYGIGIAQGVPIFSMKDFKKKVSNLGPDALVVKAQIHAGGRGKAGGVKVVSSLVEAEECCKTMLNSNLVTSQTGSEGQTVRCVYIEKAQKIKKEYYLSVVLDRECGRVVFVFSSEGGVDIEDVAHNTPEKIFKVAIDPLLGMQKFYVRKLVDAAGFNYAQGKKFADVINALYNLFIKTDASQIEINPLIEGGENDDFIALDGKINFDDSALIIHPDIAALRDVEEEDPSEVLASKYGLNYVKMNGKIGCIVNGAGLAMATMDIIKYYGSSPANFLDVGGGATLEAVIQAFKIILSDDGVEGILVSIFGGIMRCNIIAEGIIEAVKSVKMKVPVVVRLVGTNCELGRKLLSDSGLNIVSAGTLEEAAQAIVALVEEEIH